MPFTLTPVLLNKKIDKNDLYFVNYLRDTTLIGAGNSGGGMMNPLSIL
jgi:hypothetical protein